MGDEETYKLMGVSKIGVMISGRAVECTSGQLTYLEPDNQKERISGRCSNKGFEMTGSAFIKEPSNTLRDLLSTDKMDVTITSSLGHLPRKMKKASRSTCSRMTKWKHKVVAYIRRKTLHIPNAEMVITEEQCKILAATIRTETHIERKYGL